MVATVVTLTGSSVAVRLVQSAPPDTSEETHDTQAEGSESGTGTGTAEEEDTHAAAEEEVDPGPNPIVPELKEVAWGAGAFIVFALIMRYLAFPRLKRGMDARYAGIRADHENAEATRAAAQAEVAEYQHQLTLVRAEAAGVLDQARQRLEAERSARLATVNAELAEQRAAAAAENEAARVAVQDQIEAAVADVTASAVRLAVGQSPDPALVRRVVSEVMGAGVSR